MSPALVPSPVVDRAAWGTDDDAMVPLVREALARVDADDGITTQQLGEQLGMGAVSLDDSVRLGKCLRACGWTPGPQERARDDAGRPIRERRYRPESREDARAESPEASPELHCVPGAAGVEPGSGRAGGRFASAPAMDADEVAEVIAAIPERAAPPPPPVEEVVAAPTMNGWRQLPGGQWVRHAVPSSPAAPEVMALMRRRNEVAVELAKIDAELARVTAARAQASEGGGR